MTTVTRGAATAAPLSIEDLRNPNLISGFHYVTGAGAGPNGGGRGPFWRARDRRAASWWYGPIRRTPEHAAQDYVEHRQGYSPVAQYRRPAGTGRPPLPDTPEVRAALDVLKRAREAQGHPGYVYLFTDGTALKLGYTTNVSARLAEHQTGNPRELRLVAARRGTLAEEKAMKARHAASLMRPKSEWFALDRAIVQEFGLTLEDLL